MNGGLASVWCVFDYEVLKGRFEEEVERQREREIDLRLPSRLCAWDILK